MRWYRVWGITLRYLFLMRHSLDKLSDMFFWPAADLVLWGLTSRFITEKGGIFGNKILLMILSGIILWIFVWRGNYEVSVGILEDFWNRTLGNIFITPLKLSEWVAAFFLIGLIKAVGSVLFAAFLALFLYKASLFSYGFRFLIFIPLLLMTGWWIGLFIGGLLLRFGRKIQTFAWTAAAAIAPFSAVYYPVSVLPDWAQKIAKVVPTSYVFENMRSVIIKGNFSLREIGISFGLNIIYLVLALFFFVNSFKKALKRGLLSVN